MQLVCRGYGINTVYKSGANRFVAENNTIFKKQFVAGTEASGKIICLRYSTLGIKDLDLDYSDLLKGLKNTYV